MEEVKLKKRWKNHPAGSSLWVNRGVKADLVELDVLEAKEPERKSPMAPDHHKMVGSAPTQKRKRTKKRVE